jgi:hypothetical protein
MKISIRLLAAAFVLAAAACGTPAPTEPAVAAPGSVSRDDIPPPPPTDTTAARGPNLFGSGN